MCECRSMHAMVLARRGTPLQLLSIAKPSPAAGQILIRVHVCGVCRTDLHVVDGELSHPKSNLVPGHEIVGSVVEIGIGVEGFSIGDRVGVPWLGYTCGTCRFCRSGRENLCDRALFTGYTLDGGYAEFALTDSRYCFALPKGYSDSELAPLLCAGLIGFRALRMASDAIRIGIYGFGGAAHLITQIACHQGREVYAFTRTGDRQAQQFALELGAVWVGDSDTDPPEPLDAALLFAPVGELVPVALRNVTKGGRVVCAGIHMSDIPAFPYSLLWGERMICSVANLTRDDGVAFLKLAGEVHLRVQVETFPLVEANQALSALRDGKFTGAAVLTIP